jgi:glycosyltransferase involved in cell wall biosynthesis
MMAHTRLLLVTDAIGGVWAYSLELARALKPLGVETVVAVLGPPPNVRQREEAKAFKLIQTGLPLDWLETSPGELRRAGNTLAAIAAGEGADVVQTCSAALLADAEFDQPCVAVQHSCVASWWAAVKGTPLPYEFAWRRELVECGLNRAAAVVAPTTAFAAETARIYDVPASAVHNGRRAVASVATPQGDFVFTASRLWDEGKNAATLDAAASLLDVAFEAAGPTRGPNGATVELTSMRAVGEVSSARLSTLLSARPIYASAALYEPFGLSVLEAAQAGCALVLSDIATHRELWDGAAVFVPARDATAFADAARHLLSEPDERLELGRRARERAQVYAPEQMARGMADIFTRVATPQIGLGALKLAGAA